MITKIFRDLDENKLFTMAITLQQSSLTDTKEGYFFKTVRQTLFVYGYRVQMIF